MSHIRHKDGDPNNNSPDNLELVSKEQQQGTDAEFELAVEIVQAVMSASPVAGAKTHAVEQILVHHRMATKIVSDAPHENSTYVEELRKALDIIANTANPSNVPAYVMHGSIDDLKRLARTVLAAAPASSPPDNKEH